MSTDTLCQIRSTICSIDSNAFIYEKIHTFHSFDLDKVHFVVFSTEFYFYTNYGWDQIQNQWNWLVSDLQKANANRASVPWLITLGHRPMYCSDYDGDDCTKYESIVRTGLPIVHAYGLEKLFFEYGVDLELWAHEHTYERMWPVYNRTVFNGTTSAYVNPPAPVHVVSGSAGCRENTDVFMEHPGPWSARRSTDYGFGRMRIHNATHLHFWQVSAIKVTTFQRMYGEDLRFSPTITSAFTRPQFLRNSTS
uniref:Metallophos domain-containing protein n=1 Tax=Heterorhabditis bacteriophora TaxID=37862 RepID=A0A1I7XK84_HETBA